MPKYDIVKKIPYIITYKVEADTEEDALKMAKLMEEGSTPPDFEDFVDDESEWFVYEDEFVVEVEK